jgi:hypothetical protein
VLTWDKVNSFNGGGVHPVSSQNSIFIYTTNLVEDSQGHRESPLVLKEINQLNISIARLQFLQCSKSLVLQSGTLDSQLNTINGSSLDPCIYKTYSNWMPAVAMNFSSQDSTLLGGDQVCRQIHPTHSLLIFYQWPYILGGNEGNDLAAVDK